MCHMVFRRFLAHEYLQHFQLWAILYNMSVNIEYKPLCRHILFPLVDAWVELLGHLLSLGLNIYFLFSSYYFSEHFQYDFEKQ